MGLILIPSEVMQRTENLSEIVPRIVEGYQNVLQTIRDFSSESELDTEAWNTLKIRVLDYHQNIAKGILAAGDDMISDADTLQQSVGTEELYEDTLKDIIEKLEKEKEEYENKIQNLEMLCNGFWGGLLGVACSWINRIIVMLQEEISRINQQIEIYKEKLQFLYDVNTSTQNLFETVNQLLAIVEMAIHDAGVEITGNGEMSDGNWKLQLTEFLKTEEADKEITTEWLPEIMQLDGNSEQEKMLLRRINTLNNKISEADKEKWTWDQRKIDRVWERCREYYDEYGVQVDPRLLIAIVCVEGTGSFNTNSVVKAGDGGNGPQEDFEKDLDYALDLVGGKVIVYAAYQQSFSEVRQKAYEQGLSGIKDYDDILHYINWQTPRVSLVDTDNCKLESGVYAEDKQWNTGVREIYSEFSYDKVSLVYTEYALSLGVEKRNEIMEKYGIEDMSGNFIATMNGNDERGEEDEADEADEAYTIVWKTE